MALSANRRQKWRKLALLFLLHLHLLRTYRHRLPPMTVSLTSGTPIHARSARPRRGRGGSASASMTAPPPCSPPSTLPPTRRNPEPTSSTSPTHPHSSAPNGRGRTGGTESLRGTATATTTAAAPRSSSGPHARSVRRT